ncbi:signal peptidase I [Microbacterium sp. MYb64]|uniref:signal peptidase I n=1 Tax=Microbacterium sp. MYb64 TaxID=1848691 RepID=UPI000CFCD9A3|nr:signal peptidase I [Microbacterium sp. MYb64]PRB08947.1 signal peptidase I [Microbacterium sp. MYb64]
MTQATTPAPLTRRAQRESDSTAPRRRSTARGVLSEVLLWVAALAGLICIVLVVLAFTAHITLIMFRTGSMSPTIPAGSVAIVQQIQAGQVHVGDVVTVDRPGQLPVTHRVRAVEDGASSAQRLITLRGDANAQDDPAPYPVSTVRIVRFAIPGLAPVIVAFGNPFVLGGLTLGATALVIWAFWPRTGGHDRKVDEVTEGAPGS